MTIIRRETRTKIRKDSRTLPIYGHPDFGEGQDVGKYYRCWNCGFICDVDRDELGGPDSRSGVTATAYTQVDQYGNTAYHCEGFYASDSAACEAGGGTWTSTKYEPVVGSGCGFCGTLNWRGDY